MRIVPASLDDLDVVARLRHALWPHNPVALMASDAIENYFTPGAQGAIFLALSDGGEAIGYCEVSLRHDHVNGCETSPVAFLKGIYVAPEHRRAGIARALVDAALGWGRAQNSTEFASDALADNEASHRFHEAVGFSETRRVVYFRRMIEEAGA